MAGLRSAAASVRHAGGEPDDIVLRSTRQKVGVTTLNHQLPILHGLNAANRVVEGHTAQTWAHQLDRRIFFWPRSKGEAFAKSVQRDVKTKTIWLDAASFADAFMDHIDLCAINSGNFLQGGANALRGDWIYRPLSEGLPAFRIARQNRGLIKGKDAINEVSLRCAIPPDILRGLQI